MSADCATSTIWPDFYLSGRDMPDVHSVAVRGLHLPQGILCPNIWGVSKPQPAVLDIELVLSQGVHSAAAKDALDTSTIDYGLLSKRVRASNESAINVSETFVRIKDIISRSNIDNNTVSHAVSQGRLAIRLPKSTVYGENITIVDHWSSTVKDSNLLKPTRPGGENYSESPVSSRIVTFSRLRTMTLIGVNANERTGPQALLVTCSLFFAAGQGQETDTLSALSYERALVEVCV